MMTSVDSNFDDFRPTASLEMLRVRAKLLKSIRQFFDAREFFEVETPLLSHDIVIDRHLHPIGISEKEVTGRESDAEERLWLQTSPEFGMKRLVADGAEAIYQICKAFRQGESGSRHNPEFSMLEWYRVGDNMQSGIKLLSDFVESVIEKPRPALISYEDAFKKYAAIDPFRATMDELANCVAAADVQVQIVAEESNRDEFLNLILSEIVESQLGVGQPEIVFDWPASQSALAMIREDDVPVAERFELYIDGFELANGYHELLDAEELRSRNSVNNQLRVKDGNSLLPEESRLLKAMVSGMPVCAGVALGVDRLLMLMAEVKTISEVLAFPIERA